MNQLVVAGEVPAPDDSGGVDMARLGDSELLQQVDEKWPRGSSEPG
ncbi:hypothetical protein OG418_48255 [Streptomyces phaeochromogenes]